MPETWEQIRDEVHRRFREWGRQGAPARRYALLVAGYCRTQAEHLADQMALTLRDGELVRLAEWVEAAADRPLTPAERADATAVGAAVGAGVQACLSGSTNGGFLHNPFGVVDCLRTAFDDPLRAAGRLIGYPGVASEEGVWPPPSPPSYSSVRRVMDCLCPARWDPTADWTPPPEAVPWARRMYEGRAFDALPVLADLLEESGCLDRPLLDHCRQSGDHFRGCAAVDRLLGHRWPNPT